jgi:hypothetical protein
VRPVVCPSSYVMAYLNLSRVSQRTKSAGPR